MDVNEVTAKSMQFQIGEDIIQISGRRVRGMSIVEVRWLLKVCLETVEFLVARESTFAFDKELGDTRWTIFLYEATSSCELWNKRKRLMFPIPSISYNKKPLLNVR